MEWLMTGRWTPTKQFLTDLMPHIGRQLNIDGLAGSVFVRVERGMDDPGVTVTLPGKNSWLIVLRSGRPDDMAVSLCHELVHVRQLVRGTLKRVGKQWQWCGKRWNDRTPYLEQPWEIMAFREQDLLFRRAVEKL